MYNLEVARANSFSVGSSGWIVHNARKVPNLYRGDSRHPNEVFPEGFKPFGSNKDPLQHISGEDGSGLIPTTSSPKIAREEYGPNGWVYKIRPQPGAIPANPLIRANNLPGATDFLPDHEWLVPNDIKPEDIEWARPVDKDGNWAGPKIENDCFK
jgi:hypothetical protein